MRNKRKSFLTCFMLLSFLCLGVYQNAAKAAYTPPVADYTDITTRQEMTGHVNLHHFHNIQNSTGLLNDSVNGALYLEGELSGQGWFPMTYSSVKNSLFENNKADIGGGLYMVPVNGGDIQNVLFNSNNATMYGGAVAFYSSASIATYTITDSKFTNNSADINGGAMYFGASGYHTMRNSDFIGNSAGNHGGAIYVNFSDTSSRLSIRSNDGTEHVFSGNTQKTNPQNGNTESNAIYIQKGKVALYATDNSTLKFDDAVEGFDTTSYDEHDMPIKTYHGTIDIDASKNGEVVFNDKIKGLITNVTSSENSRIIFNNQVKDLVLTHKSGNLLLNHGDRLADGKAIMKNVDLIFAPDGGDSLRFDLANGKLDNILIRNLSITEPTGDQKLLIALDVDLNQGLSDFFEVAGGSTGALKFDTDHFELNIIDDGNADKFQLISGVPDSFLTGELIQFSENGKYKFTVGENGFINVTKEDTSGLPEAVVSDEAIREYVASENIKLTQPLGVMGGESLTINMKDFNLDGNRNKGITLASNQSLTIKNAGEINGGALSNFYTDGNGAVVNNIGGALTITDSTFADNKSDGKGGAIYALGGAVTVNADTRDVIFKNNIHQIEPAQAPEIPETPDTPDNTEVTRSSAALKTAVESLGIKNDIYLENNTTDDTKATLTINGAKNTVVESGIAGNGDVVKNSSGVLKLGGNNADFTGDVYLNGGEIQLLSGATYFNALNTYVKNNSRINLANNNPNDVVNFGNLKLDGTAKLGIDIDAKNSLNDKIGAASVEGGGKILIDNVNIMSLANGTTQFDVITLQEGDDGKLTSPLLGLVELTPEAKNVISPIFKYQADFNSDTGVMSLVSGSPKNKNSYNPSILATPVALQTAAQAGIKEAMNSVFEHSDSFTKLPFNERFAQINSNKYAISEFNGQLPLYNGQTEGSAFWFRPYTVFESIDLSHGPKVDNLSYGSLIGFDSKFKERKHGWTSLTSSFLGYHGSSLDYSDVDITSNGALLGLTKNYYKKNFWTALSMTGSADLGKISEMYGNDDIVSLNGGVSSKTGYNMEFNEGKFIIQPNVSLSYYISKIFDYTNEAGVKIDSDPLHSFEIKPGIRLIGNTESGWQPYLSAAFVWNTFNDTDVRANGIKLPEMSMDPYVEYGLGIQRVMNNDFTCYLQSLVRNGGRTGVALTGGMSWAVGKENARVHL